MLFEYHKKGIWELAEDSHIYWRLGCSSALGVIFMFFFWAIVPAILGLLCWFGAVIFVTLAIHGMSYADWDTERRARSSLAKKRKSELVEQKKSD